MPYNMAIALSDTIQRFFKCEVYECYQLNPSSYIVSYVTTSMINLYYIALSFKVMVAISYILATEYATYTLAVDFQIIFSKISYIRSHCTQLAW